MTGPAGVQPSGAALLGVAHRAAGFGRNLLEHLRQHLLAVRASRPSLLASSEEAAERPTTFATARWSPRGSRRLGRASLAGLRGYGLITVLRTDEGDVVEAHGVWQPEHRQAKLRRLEQALDTRSSVMFEGPIRDPASGGAEIEEARTQVYVTAIHHYSGDDGRAHVIADFVVHDGARSSRRAPGPSRTRADGAPELERDPARTKEDEGGA